MMVKNFKHLTDEQYRVTQQHGTEPAFSGAYWDKKDDGHYNCICCGVILFSSETKFESNSGWPSFLNQYRAMWLVNLLIILFLCKEPKFIVQSVKLT